jgi:hypothetical protein
MESALLANLVLKRVTRRSGRIHQIAEHQRNVPTLASSGVEAAATGAVDSGVVDGVCAGLTVTSSRDTVTTSWVGDGGTVPSRSRLLGDDLEGRSRRSPGRAIQRRQTRTRDAAEAIGWFISGTIACPDRTG